MIYHLESIVHCDLLQMFFGVVMGTVIQNTPNFLLLPLSVNVILFIIWIIRIIYNIHVVVHLFILIW